MAVVASFVALAKITAMKTWFLLGSTLLLFTHAHAQKSRPSKASIVSCDCRFKVDSSYIVSAPPRLQQQPYFELTIDSSLTTRCGYLLVPENRKKPNSRLIRLPFIVLQSKNPHKQKDPLLFTSGGPGNSSLGWINGISKSPLLNDRDCIAFEQRGTRYAIPYLRSFEIDSAMKIAYRRNLPKDSMWMEGVKRYRKRLLQKGVDLAGYNSDETVQDIRDLLSQLQIDSVNLFGGSYSGGLMMAVLQKEPNKVRSLILDSPLPMFSPIDEDEPVNFIEGLRVLCHRAANDSADKALYGQLWERFHQYFTSIKDKTFILPYPDPQTGDTLPVQYGKNELLDVVVTRLLDNGALKELPHVITELLKGNHYPYLFPRINRIIQGWPAPDGMRMSVYCADQAQYHNEAIIQQLYQLYPYLDGFRINDVWKAVCDCWQVPPVHHTTKQAFYSGKPALIADGEMDAACRPLYMLHIKHYMPHAQTFLFRNRTHGVGGRDFTTMMQQFLEAPYQTITPTGKEMIAY